MADGANLAQVVGDGEELGGAGEEFAAEVRAQAVAQDREFEPVGDAGELPDLRLRQELRLVDEDAVDLLLACSRTIQAWRSSASP